MTLLFWLGCQDSNLGMPESKSGALPLGDSPKCPLLAQKVRMAFYKSKWLLASSKKNENAWRAKLSVILIRKMEGGALILTGIDRQGVEMLGLISQDGAGKKDVLEIADEIALAGKTICPRCGDTKFGSTQLPDGTLLRTCHGSLDGETPCMFQWPESDDHLYFYVPLELALRLKVSL